MDENVFNLRSMFAPREIEVLKLIARGYSDKQIAAIMGISTQTTKNYVSSLIEKLNVENRTAAVVKAYELHIIELGRL